LLDVDPAAKLLAILLLLLLLLTCEFDTAFDQVVYIMLSR
jgi:hypothetical protein